MEKVFVYDFASNIKSPITKIYTSHRNGKIIARPMRPIKTKSAPKYFIFVLDYIHYIYRFIVFINKEFLG